MLSSYDFIYLKLYCAIIKILYSHSLCTLTHDLSTSLCPLFGSLDLFTSLRLSMCFSSQQKDGFFILFILEKSVKVALLNDFSCKMMSFLCLWNDLHVKFKFLCDFLWKKKSFINFFLIFYYLFLNLNNHTFISNKFKSFISNSCSILNKVHRWKEILKS